MQKEGKSPGGSSGLAAWVLFSRGHKDKAGRLWSAAVSAALLSFFPTKKGKAKRRRPPHSKVTPKSPLPKSVAAPGLELWDKPPRRTLSQRRRGAISAFSFVVRVTFR